MTEETAVAVAQGIELRPAVPEDAEGCATVFNDWVDATPWMPRVHDRSDVLRHFHTFVLPQRRVTVADRDGVVGFIALGDSHVDGLYLAPAARRQGVGTALIATAKAASPAGLTLHTFVANTAARAFYAAQGFVELQRSEGDNEEGLPDILLAWLGSL